jgi:hypothetical protein
MQMQQAANELLPIVTRLKCRKIANVEGSIVFAVPRGWPAERIRNEPEIVTAETPTAFDAALQAANCHAIFIPRDTFGWNLMERILRRNSLTKTIFWEE